MIHWIPYNWLRWWPRKFPLCFSQKSPQPHVTPQPSWVKEYSERSRQGQLCSSFVFRPLLVPSFCPSYLLLLLLLTTVIYGGHPSSGCVHHLLVARQSWQQLCVVRGVWSSHSQAPTFISFTPDSTLTTQVPVLVPAPNVLPVSVLFPLQPHSDVLT